MRDGGHQVVGAVAVEVNGAFLLQHLDERLQGQVAIGCVAFAFGSALLAPFADIRGP